MARYDVHGSDVVWEGQLSTARVDQVEMPDGSTAAREVVRHLDAVAVVALTDDDEIVLVRQYRHAIGAYQLEIPAGLLDVDGEAPEAAAVRELAEETGMKVRELRQVLGFANSSGWTDEHTTIFFGRGAVPDTPLNDFEAPPEFEAKDEEADMQVVILPFSEAVAMARDGQLADAKTLIGILAVAAQDGGRRG